MGPPEPAGGRSAFCYGQIGIPATRALLPPLALSWSGRSRRLIKEMKWNQTPLGCAVQPIDTYRRRAKDTYETFDFRKAENSLRRRLSCREIARIPLRGLCTLLLFCEPEIASNGN